MNGFDWQNFFGGLVVGATIILVIWGIDEDRQERRFLKRMTRLNRKYQLLQNKFRSSNPTQGETQP